MDPSNHPSSHHPMPRPRPPRPSAPCPLPSALIDRSRFSSLRGTCTRSSSTNLALALHSLPSRAAICSTACDSRRRDRVPSRRTNSRTNRPIRSSGGRVAEYALGDLIRSWEGRRERGVRTSVRTDRRTRGVRTGATDCALWSLRFRPRGTLGLTCT